VLSTLLGGGMSSRLFQEIREKRGLVYSIYTFTSAFADGGIFGVYAGTGEAEAAELVPVLCDELARVGADASAQEVDRARAQLKASLLMGLESTSARAEQTAHQIIAHRRPITAEEIVDKLEAVDEAAVRRAARRLLASPPTLAALGPLDGLQSYDWIRARLA
jgi:predicted Zn-dependent peptidase